MRLKVISIAVASVVALAVFGNIMHNIEDRQKEAAAQAAQTAKLRLAQEKRKALAAELAATKPRVLELSQGLIDQGEFDAAQTLLTRFAQLQDPEIESLRALAVKTAETAQRVKKLLDELASKPGAVRGMAIYKEMAALEPSNPLWPALMREAKPMVAAAQAQQARDQAVAARQEAVKRLFSPWDGSVRSVEEAIKARLKDPDSYKHVETRFKDSGVGNVTVFTQYRARNSFNALIPGIATTVVSPTGELVSFTMN